MRPVQGDKRWPLEVAGRVVPVAVLSMGNPHAVQIVSDGPDGMWVTGVPSGADVITVGQEFVTEGAHVKPVVTGARA